MMNGRKRWIVLVGVGIILYCVRRRRNLSKKREKDYVVKLSLTSKGKSSSLRSGIHGQVRSRSKSQVDIGAALGMDIGGSLAKLVYFEKKAEYECFGRNYGTMSSHHDPIVKLKRNLSLGDLMKNEQNKEALEEFYNFMDTKDQFGTAGVKDEHLAYHSFELGGQLHFFRFETRMMEKAIELIQNSTIHHSIKALGCTGGGAFKFEEFFLKRLGVTMVKIDEMASLVRGLQFCIEHIPGECYTFEPEITANCGENGASKVNANESDTFRNMRMRYKSEMREKVEYTRKISRNKADLANSFPALVVNIGSGVSIIKIDGPNKFERVSGSSIGGGTYWGLCRLLTNATKYDMNVKLAENGDSNKVDMLVGDIYGQGYSKFQLSSSTVASSFGKIGIKENPLDGIEDQDLSKALIIMITMNIGQVAYMNAKLYDTTQIYFVGNFLRQNKISIQKLSFAIDYWSSGEMEALFLEHEGYLGALGAFLTFGFEESDSLSSSSSDCD